MSEVDTRLLIRSYLVGVLATVFVLAILWPAYSIGGMYGVGVAITGLHLLLKRT